MVHVTKGKSAPRGSVYIPIRRAARVRGDLVSSQAAHVSEEADADGALEGTVPRVRLLVGPEVLLDGEVLAAHVASERADRGVGPFVRAEAAVREKRLPAPIAPEGLRESVPPQMHLQPVREREGPTALGARETPVDGVRHQHVPKSVRLRRKSLPALMAREGPVGLVGEAVPLHVPLLRESALAKVARERALPRVHAQVRLQAGLSSERAGALRAPPGRRVGGRRVVLEEGATFVAFHRRRLAARREERGAAVKTLHGLHGAPTRPIKKTVENQQKMNF